MAAKLNEKHLDERELLPQTHSLSLNLNFNPTYLSTYSCIWEMFAILSILLTYSSQMEKRYNFYYWNITNYIITASTLFVLLPKFIFVLQY